MLQIHAVCTDQRRPIDVSAGVKATVSKVIQVLPEKNTELLDGNNNHHRFAVRILSDMRRSYLKDILPAKLKMDNQMKSEIASCIIFHLGCSLPLKTSEGLRISKIELDKTAEQKLSTEILNKLFQDTPEQPEKIEHYGLCDANKINKHLTYYKSLTLHELIFEGAN